jgi:hypothetical protein
MRTKYDNSEAVIEVEPQPTMVDPLERVVRQQIVKRFTQLVSHDRYCDNGMNKLLHMAIDDTTQRLINVCMDIKNR